MEDIDRMEREQQLIDACMFNTYAYVTGLLTFEQVLEEEEPWLLFVPGRDDDGFTRREAIKTLIDYYAEREEYEKCQDLVELQK